MVEEKRAAVEKEHALDWETIHRKADQERRREFVRRNEEAFARRVAPRQHEATAHRDTLTQMYAAKREADLDAEEERRSTQARDYKTGIMAALAEQKRDTQRLRKEESMQASNLERMQLKANMERDERLIEEEKQKALRRRQLGQQWMKDAEVLYLKQLEEN